MLLEPSALVEEKNIILLIPYFFYSQCLERLQSEQNTQAAVNQPHCVKTGIVAHELICFIFHQRGIDPAMDLQEFLEFQAHQESKEILWVEVWEFLQENNVFL